MFKDQFDIEWPFLILIHLDLSQNDRVILLAPNEAVKGKLGLFALVHRIDDPGLCHTLIELH